MTIFSTSWFVANTSLDIQRKNEKTLESDITYCYIWVTLTVPTSSLTHFFQNLQLMPCTLTKIKNHLSNTDESHSVLSKSLTEVNDTRITVSSLDPSIRELWSQRSRPRRRDVLIMKISAFLTRIYDPDKFVRRTNRSVWHYPIIRSWSSISVIWSDQGDSSQVRDWRRIHQ